jgi:hypothetical protein
MALGSKPYSWRKGMARKANSSFKWLIPVVAYGQVSEKGERVTSSGKQRGISK